MSQAYPPWAWAYDAVALLGISACRLDAEGLRATGANLHSAILNTSFVGVSGPVSLLPDGNRDPDTSVYMLNNVQLNNVTGIPENVPIAVWTPTDKNWTLNLDLAVFRDMTSNPPPDIDVPVENKNLLPDYAKGIGYFETAFVLAASLASLIWLRVNRTWNVVVASQPAFMKLIALGIACLGASIIPLTFEYSDAACMAFPWLVAMGLTLSIAPIGVKSLRVGRLWYHPGRGQREKPRERGVLYLGMVLAVAMVDVVLLIAWTLTAPLKYERVITYQDVFGNPVNSYGICAIDSSASIGFLVTLLVFNGLIAVGVVAVSVWVSNAPAKFQEARWTAFAAVALAELFVFGIPLVATVISLPVARFFVLSSLCFLTSLALLGSMFLPKIIVGSSEGDSEERRASRTSSPGSITTRGGQTSSAARQKKRLDSPSGLAPWLQSLVRFFVMEATLIGFG